MQPKYIILVKKGSNRISLHSVIQFAMDRTELCKGFEEDKERPYNVVQYYEALPASARGVFYCWLISYVSKPKSPLLSIIQKEDMI